MGDKPRCTGTTKKGTPCKAPPLKGTKHCLAHAPEEVRETARFGGSQPGSGRPKNPRAVDVLRERLEEDIDKALKPLWDALSADKAVVVGSGEDAFVEYTPDFPVRLKAVAELLDRAYGKPRQMTEVTGPDGGPLQTRADLSSLSDEDLATLAGVLAKTEETETGG